MKYLVKIFIFSSLLLSAEYLCAHANTQQLFLLSTDSNLIRYNFHNNEGQVNTNDNTRYLKCTNSSKLKSPKLFQEVYFYCLTPTLACLGSYNNLKHGDLLKLLILKISRANIRYSPFRLLKIGLDCRSKNSGIKNVKFLDRYNCMNKCGCIND